MSDNGQIQWLLDAGEPWTRYRTLIDLLGRPVDDPLVTSARAEMIAHPQVQDLIAGAAVWPSVPLRRHNDAAHPVYKLATLVDFGLRHDDPGLTPIVEAILAHQSAEGAFQSLVNIPVRFGGSGEDMWTWVTCDAPTLLYILLGLGRQGDGRVGQGVAHLVSLAGDGGWGCVAAPTLGKFHGPGRRTDPCPIANVYALKALSLVPEQMAGPAARAGIEMLLGHWQRRREVKYFMFGIGTDFQKAKYPFVWYDILHVVDVLSRFPIARADMRLIEMQAMLSAQLDTAGRCTAGSMYQAWKGWSFADKKHPSPWLTFLVARAAQRCKS